MPSLTEQDVLAIIRKELDDPFSVGAKALKGQVPGYLEIHPPDLLLNQTLGWNAHIGNNGQNTCSSPLTLDTAAAVLSGTEGTLYHPGDYVLWGLFEFTFAAASAARAPGTAANVDNAGGNAWSNPNNAKVQDTTYATVITDGGSDTDFLRLTNCGFTAPSTAVIAGVTVVVRGKVNTSGASPTWRTKLVIGGSPTGNEKTASAHTSDTDETFGGAADLWGTTPTVAQLTASDFGVDVYCSSNISTRTFSCDYVTIQLSWSAALTNDLTGLLYVSGSPYGVAPVLGAMPVGTRAHSWEWFVTTTTENVPVALYAKKGYTAGTGTATTNSSMIIARLR